MSSPPVTIPAVRLVPSSRYRHPGDVIRLISAALLLAVSLAVSAAAFRWLLGPAAPVPGGLGPAGRVITGLVQVTCLAAAVFSVLMALSRAYLGAHWLSDALAGSSSAPRARCWPPS